MLESSQETELKKFFYQGPVYKSTLIDQAIEKGEFTLWDLKDHFVFEVRQEETPLGFPFISMKIKYTQREIVFIFDKFASMTDSNESKVMDEITAFFPWRKKESVKNFRKTVKNNNLTLDGCFTSTYKDSPYCFNF